MVDFKEMFEIEVSVSSFKGDLAGFLKKMIEKTFCHSNDDLQNLSYLKVNARLKTAGFAAGEYVEVECDGDKITLIKTT